MNSIFEKSLILLERINVEGFDGFRPNPETGQMLRPQQVVAIRQILHLMYHENIKYISLTAPTGSGKSIIGAVLAKIVYELEGGKTNLTTSSRALQKQYGNSLKVDEDFKVVMGTTNYKCSFFVDSKRRRYTAAESPCRDYKAYFDDHWDERIFPNQDDPNDMIKTIHEDQDEEIVTNLSNSEVLIENDMEEHREKLPKNKKDELLIYSMKTSCTEHGACSFYKARGAADEAPVAIRSIQHLMFYIMYQVGGIMPVLQERDLHIHDESHSIESVFREFFSVQFSELSYQDILSRINSSRRINLQIIESFSGIHKKEVSQWNGVDVYIACKTIEENLAKVVEKTAMVDENMLRSDKLTSAFEYAKAMGAGELMSDPDMIDEDVRKIVRWYKNIHHANSDQKFYLRQKEKGHRYNKKYGAQVKVDGRTTSINIYPISLEGMALRYFGTRNTVFMSATPLSGKVFENMFGLVGKVGYVEIESDFPTQRSPIFYDPVVTNTIDGAKALGLPYVKNNVKEKDIEAQKIGTQIIHQELSKKIIEIADHFSGLSGIVPCASYTSVRMFREYINDNRFIWALESAQNLDAIKEFTERARAGESVFLVSAGISEGHSFDNDISRVQILTKYPYPARDSVMVDLCKRWGESYYGARTAMTLQQMAGRSMRSAEDWCVTIMLDKKFDVLKNPKLHQHYSKHFIKCLMWDQMWQLYEWPTDG